MTRVGVIGAAGRMGSEVCRAVAATDDCELVAAVDRGHGGDALRDLTGADVDVTISSSLEALSDAGVEVAIDFTHPTAVVDNVGWLLDTGIHAVVGTTGIGAEDLDDLRRRAEASPANVFIAPNFAIGAVLMMQLAAEAARHLPHVEIIELHHDRKADAPSGTALRTAELIDAARARHPEPIGGDAAHLGARGTVQSGIAIHSVRLPGLVAHQEVILGGEGQTLTIRHDSLDRSSFMPGVLLAVRSVASLPESLVVGLERLLR